MTIGIAKPFESLRAILAIEDAEEDSGQFGPQIKLTLEVTADGQDGEHNGIVFTDWLSLDEHSGNVKPRSKAWQVIEAILGEVPANLEAEDLLGGRFAAQVGLNKKKTHSKVVHDTIGPAPTVRAKDDGDLDDVDDLLGIEALDVAK
jgi:hypothetical protein